MFFKIFLFLALVASLFSREDGLCNLVEANMRNISVEFYFQYATVLMEEMTFKDISIFSSKDPFYNGVKPFVQFW